MGKTRTTNVLVVYLKFKFNWGVFIQRASLVAQTVKNLPAMQVTQVWSLGGGEDPPEKEMATHSSILAWRIWWTEEPGVLQSMGLQRVGHNWTTNTHIYTKKKSFVFIWYLNLTGHLTVLCAKSGNSSYNKREKWVNGWMPEWQRSRKPKSEIIAQLSYGRNNSHFKHSIHRS